MKQKPENAAAKSICQMAKTINDQNTPEIKTKKRLVQLTDRLKNFTQACSILMNSTLWIHNFWLGFPNYFLTPVLVWFTLPCAFLIFNKYQILGCVIEEDSIITCSKLVANNDRA